MIAFPGWLAPWEVAVFAMFSMMVFLVGRRMTAIHSQGRSGVAMSASAPRAGAVDPSLLRVRYAPTDRSGTANRNLGASLDRWIGRMLGRAGSRMESSTVVVATVCLSVSTGTLGAVLGLAVPAVISVSVVTCLLALGTLYLRMALRIRRFIRQFPSSLELMARATRAGADLEAAMRVALETSDEPIRSELSLCVQQIQWGLTPAQSTSDLAERIGSPDLQLFAHTIATHGQVGGKLAVALEKLSAIIRERAELGEKIRAATGIARLAIFTVVVIAAFVLIYMQVAQPEYIQKLSKSSFGQKLIIYAIVSECIGLVWVAVTLKLEY